MQGRRRGGWRRVGEKGEKGGREGVRKGQVEKARGVGKSQGGEKKGGIPPSNGATYFKVSKQSRCIYKNKLNFSPFLLSNLGNTL